MVQRYFIGLMSGTSMDGADGVLVRFAPGAAPHVLADAHLPFDDALRDALFALQSPGDNEIHRESLAANQLAEVYAACCNVLLERARRTRQDITAVGVHGQTIRHRPELGYTRQTNQAAGLAERVGIDVIADFRSRDVAAGGQGAPLVPAFHAMVFGAAGETRVICNIGGISNISILEGQTASRGFDCGPGNALMDAWVERQLGTPFDKDGAFASRGHIDHALLQLLEQEPFFSIAPPKSTGRDLFNADWLSAQLKRYTANRHADCGVGNIDNAPLQIALIPEDVQATLTAFTANAIARDVLAYAPACQTVFVCGGGAHNPVLLGMLKQALNASADQPHAIAVQTTDALGMPSQQVEALAFAWLAMRFVDRAPGNLPAVTGAAGLRVLGALYPA